MDWRTWVGFRYLRSRKSNRFLSLITWLSVLGVCVGVMSLIVVLSVMEGFEKELKKRLVSSDLHILMTPDAHLRDSDGFVAADYLNDKEVSKRLISDARVISFAPILSTEAILRHGRRVSGVALKGMGPERWKLFQPHVVESLDPRAIAEPSGAGATEVGKAPRIFLGRELAYALGVIPGDWVTLVSPLETSGPLGLAPRVVRFLVGGIYTGGSPDQELTTAWAKMADVEGFLRKTNVVTQWEVTLGDFEAAHGLAQELRALSPELKIQDWIDLNATLFASLRLERFAMFVILAFIVVVASFNIVTTLTLMVIEKKPEISILRAMGAKASDIGRITMTQGGLIGLVGVGGGTVIALVLSLLLKRFQIIQLPDVYVDRSLPVAIEPEYYLVIPIAALAIVMLACLYPTRRSTLVTPLEGIRARK